MTIKTANDFLDIVIEDLQDLVKDKAGKLFDLVVMYTPIQTGNLRASWSMTEGAPEFVDIVYGTIESPAPGAIKPELILTSKFPIVHVSNGKSYALFVEHGTSKMAPRAMVARALAEV